MGASKLLGFYFDAVEIACALVVNLEYRNKEMLLLLLGGIGSVLSCLSSYTLLSGTRTYYYDPTSNELKQALVLPSSALLQGWQQDSEAVWVWWTLSSPLNTVKFKDSFILAQRAVSQINTAVLKIASDDCLKVTFNGVVLINTDYVPYSAYLVVDLKDKLRGASDSEYAPNVLEMEVTSDGAWEGLLYRVDITFN